MTIALGLEMQSLQFHEESLSQFYSGLTAHMDFMGFTAKELFPIDLAHKVGKLMGGDLSFKYETEGAIYHEVQKEGVVIDLWSGLDNPEDALLFQWETFLIYVYRNWEEAKPKMWFRTLKSYGEALSLLGNTGIVDKEILSVLKNLLCFPYDDIHEVVGKTGKFHDYKAKFGFEGGFHVDTQKGRVETHIVTKNNIFRGYRHFDGGKESVVPTTEFPYFTYMPIAKEAS